MALTSVTVALDWTPNTNHTGFYVAKALGLFEKEGLDVKLLGTNDPVYQGSYSSAPGGEGAEKDTYQTPCSMVADGVATFAMNSPEGVINWNTSPGRPPLKAVAAILQKQTSAIVTTKASGVARPRDLDGKCYASYAARFEGRIVQQMIIADGGRGEFTEETPPMLGIFDTILAGKADATWVFMGWEGVDAEMKGVELNAFYPQDYGIPYAYAPCLVAHPDMFEKDPETLRRFLRASSEGWKMAAEKPEESAAMLVKVAKEHNSFDINPEMARRSALFLADKCLDPSSGTWGVMSSGSWDTYTDWLCSSGLLTTSTQSRHPDSAADKASLDDLRAGKAGDPIPRDSVPCVFTNDFLPSA